MKIRTIEAKKEGNRLRKIMDNQGFDAWAENYDIDVIEIERAGRYPFAGYSQVLYEIYQEVKKTPSKKILDLGHGTGTLTKVFYQEGYEITGIDFSEAMRKIAQKVLKNARLLVHDFTLGLPDEIKGETFDCAILTYSIHHLYFDEQVSLIEELMDQCKFILIGDVMTQTFKEMQALGKKEIEVWDFDESYPVVDLYKNHFPHYKFDFTQKSYCAGVLKISK